MTTKSKSLKLTKPQLYKLALGAGAMTAMAVPLALVIACDNGPQVFDVSATTLNTELAKLKVDAVNSTTDSLTWAQTPQLPYQLTANVNTLEYLVGDYASADLAAQATTWSTTLPRQFTPSLNVKFWARAVVKPNQIALINNVFDLTTSSGLALVTKASDAAAPARTADASALTTLLKGVNYVANSNVNRVTWQGVPAVPAALLQDVAGVEYLLGNYATQTEAEAATEWSSTLSSTVTETAATNRYLWARLVAKPKVTLTPAYVNLTVDAKLASLATNSAPAPSGLASSWVFNSHRQVQVVTENASGQQDVFTTDRHYFTPASSWTTIKTEYLPMYQAMQLNLFRSVKPQEDQLVYDGNFKAERVEGTSASRLSKKRFELIKALRLTDAAGRVYVFDKDVSDNDLASDDPRDINSDYFREVFTNVEGDNRIVSMQFELRDEAKTSHWRRNFTGENGSVITAKDLYLGMMFSILNSERNRASLSNLTVRYDTKPASGSFVDVTTAIVAATKAGASEAGLRVPDNTVAGSLLYTMQAQTGLNALPFTDLDKMNEVVVDDQTMVLTFNQVANDSKIGRGNMLDYLFGNFFSAIPYQETLNAVTNTTVTARLKKAIMDLNKITEAQYAEFEKSPAYKSGYYHHFFVPSSDFYMAGKYFLNSVSSTEIIAKINEEYIDPRWTNQTNMSGQRTTIDLYRLRYQSGNSSVGVDWSSYQSGNNVAATMGSLTSDQQKNAIDNPTNYGVFYSREFTSMSTVWFPEITGLTIMPVVKDGYPQFYFNNNFSKVLYGATAEDIDKNAPNATGGKILDNLVTGTGFELRKLLTASMNAFSFVTGRFPDGLNRVDWTSLFSPEQDLWGSDLTQEKALHLINVMLGGDKNPNNDFNDEGLLSKYVFEKNADGTWATSAFSRDSYVNQSTGASFEDRFGPSTTAQVDDPLNKTIKITPFDLLKRAFKALLDRTVGPYDANNPSQTEVVWEMPYSRGGPDEKSDTLRYGYASVRSQNVYQAYKKLLEKIDKRLKVVATMTPSEKTAANVYLDAKVLVENWPGDKSWTAVRAQDDKANRFPDMHIDDRIPVVYRGKGMGVASTYMGNASFDFNAPTENIYFNFGWMQTGVMFLHSYFADPANSAALANPLIAPFSNLANIVRKLFDDYIDSAKIEDLKLTSSYANTFFDLLKSLRFANLWKSDLKAVDIYDYMGFTGLEPIIAKSNELNAKVARSETLTEDELKFLGGSGVEGDYTKIFDYLNGFFNLGVSFNVWTELQKLNTKDLVETLLAWQIVSPDNMNPMSSSIVDRRSLRRSLIKTWYYKATPGTNVGSINISSDRVDLDRKDNYYLGEPLYRDKNGQWKTVAEGGIVY